MKSHLTKVKNPTLLYYQAASVAISVWQNNCYRWLTIDDAVQSIMNIENPCALTMPHQEALVEPLEHLKPSSVLEIGLGGGNLARYIHETSAEIQFTSVEKSEIVKTCFEQFFNPNKLKLNIISSSFRRDLFPEDSFFDWIIYDIFESNTENSLPLSPIFGDLSNMLNEGGVLTMNFVNGLAPSSSLKQLEECNFELKILPVEGYRNIVVHATKH